jgi:signal transduction histidine kinase
VPGPVATAIEGAVGEALENVRRHAGTGAATVRLDAVGTGVRVTVADAGAGFAPAAVPQSRHGLVLSVRERLARAGGRAQVHSVPGAGHRGRTGVAAWMTSRWARCCCAGCARPSR